MKFLLIYASMYVRRIGSIAKWNSSDTSGIFGRDGALFTGDAISDLRTRSNTISVWQTDDLTARNIDPIIAILAMNCDSLEKIVYVVLEENELGRRGLILEKEHGICEPVNDQNLLDRHFDICKVDYWHLGILAEYIYQLVAAGKVYTVTLRDVKSKISDMIQNKQVSTDKLKDGIRRKLNM